MEFTDPVELAIYKVSFIEGNAKIIRNGIKKIKDLSFSINNFSIAGSNNQAIDDVLPATNIEKKADKIILFKNILYKKQGTKNLKSKK